MDNTTQTEEMRRDFFAAAALTGLLANNELIAFATRERPDDVMPYIAEASFGYADEMVKESAK